MKFSIFMEDAQILSSLRDQLIQDNMILCLASEQRRLQNEKICFLVIGMTKMSWIYV